MAPPVFYDDVQAGHDPSFYLVRGRVVSSPERADRGAVLLAAATAAGLERRSATPAGGAELLRVHTTGYLDFLATAWAEWQAVGGGEEVIANAFAARAHVGRPTGIVGRAGLHMGDTSCPLGRRSFEAAQAAAGTALAAARAVLQGEASAYALARPPGHHAFPDMAAGFCFLNNTALAASEVLAAGARPAILDIDVHHGNGTQAVFYDRADALHVSVHADPAGFYPWYWGYADERGAGPGEGWTLNLPLPLRSGDEAVLDAIDSGLAVIAERGADVLVVALGLDIHEADPLAGFRVTTDGFARIGARIARLRRPTIIVQEGGYPSPHLGRNLEHFLGGLLGA